MWQHRATLTGGSWFSSGLGHSSLLRLPTLLNASSVAAAHPALSPSNRLAIINIIFVLRSHSSAAGHVSYFCIACTNISIKHIKDKTELKFPVWSYFPLVGHFRFRSRNIPCCFPTINKGLAIRMLVCHFREKIRGGSTVSNIPWICFLHNSTAKHCISRLWKQV